MKIYDISQEVFSCNVYPGDRCPEKIVERRIDNGGNCNITSLAMNAHNGTHVDAPYHFCNDGKTIERMSLEKTVGKCLVISHEGVVTADDAKKYLAFAQKNHPDCAQKLLFKGHTVISQGAADLFAAEKLDLIGVELQSVGVSPELIGVHKVLLGAEVVLLEGAVLAGVDDGEYFLSAAPLSLEGSDGSPCRAILIEF